MSTLDVTRVSFSHHLVSVAIRLKDRELHVFSYGIRYPTCR